jgi:hypothetical protein
VGNAANEFDAEGRLTGARYQEVLAQLMARLAEG